MNQLDIRFPLGLLFLILGIILIGYSLVSEPAFYDRHSLGENINTIWGAVLALFGGFVLWLAKRNSPGN